MRETTPSPFAAVRAIVATGVTALVAVALGRAALALVTEAEPGTISVDDAVGLLALVVGAGAAAVLALGLIALTLGTTAQAFGRSLRSADAVARRLTPAVMRRVVTAGLAVGLGLGTAVSAQAADTDLLWVVTDGTTVAEPAEPQSVAAAPGRVGTNAPGPLVASVGTAPAAVPAEPPTRAATATEATTTETTAAQTTPAEATTVEVRPGDSLWLIAAAHLGPAATDSDIAQEWPRWHQTNRDVIGADPDHIEPGQALVTPEGADR